MEKKNICHGRSATGSGHTSRGTIIVPHFLDDGHNVHLFKSGEEKPFSPKKPMIPGLQEDEKLGVTFYYHDSGRMDFLKTGKRVLEARIGMQKSIDDLTSILNIHQGGIDFIVSDFDPYTAYLAKQDNIPCIQSSHQAAFYSDKIPRSKYWRINPAARIPEHSMKYLSPHDPNMRLAYHYESYGDEHIMPPMIKQDILDLKEHVSNEGHYIVYVWNTNNAILQQTFSQFPKKHFHIFSPKVKKKRTEGNVTFHPKGPEFMEILAGAEGAIFGAGFQGTSEALYLGKKLLAIPQPRQYEQACNAIALKEMGAQVAKTLTTRNVGDFIERGKVVHLSEGHTDSREVVEKIYQKVG